MRRIIVCLLLAALVASLTACSQTGYYLQAAKGQWQLISARQPVQQLIDAADTDATLRQQLILAQQIRRFAVDRLGLKDSKGFTSYTDLGRQHVVWNVVAAPQFSIEPKTWCFPIAGCVAYKGFFDQQMAEDEKLALLADDYDVFLYGVSAYSTLGWFADPLLNTFMHYSETDLAALIIHELAHQIVYVKDDSGFNEAFATAVEQHLLEEWLLQHGNDSEISRLRDNRQRHSVITDMVLEHRIQLSLAYADSISEQAKQQQKQQLFGEMRRRYAVLADNGNGTRYYDWWFSQELDNARLLIVSTYYQLVPGFLKMIENHDGDLSAFFDSVKALAAKDKIERDRVLGQNQG